jgi:hypothetical protein
MSTMQNFHAVLSSTSKLQDQYLEALAALTAIDFDQLKALASDLGWQEWGSPKS